MAISFMKKIGDMQKGDSLKYRLHRKMAGYEAARDHKIVHASDVTKKDFCPREFALCDATGKKPKGGFIGTSLRATFDLGNALQDMLNQKWAVDWCIGTWECKHCGEQYGFQKRPASCVECKHTHFHYLEENFVSPGCGYSGSIDYLFDPGVGKYKITEVKTMMKDEFKALKMPLAEHLVRTSIYLRLVSECNDWRTKRIDTESASILYICKGFGCADHTVKEKGIADAGFSPFKEFTVGRNDSSVDYAVQKAQEVQIYRNSGVLPGRVCPHSLCTRAKSCPVTKECWSTYYVAKKNDDRDGAL